MTRNFSPAIYDIRCRALGTAAASGYLNHVTTLGFDYVLLSGAQLGFRPASFMVPADQTPPAHFLQGIKAAGLGMVVDISQNLLFLEASAPFPLDPRRSILPMSEKDRGIARDIPNSQRELILHLLDIGVAGFRISGWDAFEIGHFATHALPPDRLASCLFVAGAKKSCAAGMPEIAQLKKPPARQAFEEINVLVENLVSPSPEQQIHEENQLRLAVIAAIWNAAIGGCGWRMSDGSEAGLSPIVSLYAEEEGGSGSLQETVRQANEAHRSYGGQSDDWNIRRLSAPNASITAELLSSPSRGELLRLTNRRLNRRGVVNVPTLIARAGGERQSNVLKARLPEDTAGNIRLDMGEIALLEISPAVPLRPEPSSNAVQQAVANPRIRIEDVTPQLDPPEMSVKRVEGDIVEIECDLIMDGHDTLAASLLWKYGESQDWQAAPMTALGNDRWQGQFQVRQIGQHYFTIEAWRDDVATFQKDISKKKAAGQKVNLELQEGISLLQSALETKSGGTSQRQELRSLLAELGQASAETQFDYLTSTRITELLSALGLRSFVTRYDRQVPLWVDRYSARFSSWYELFPRSQSATSGKHGTFLDVIDRLPAIRDMGFDTLYFPPIHPIGKINRKGRNNSLKAEADDPGSPYAIGSANGGHKALHPELGTIEDFRRLRDKAQDHGLELAMDFAIQCAPDHPWLREHPDWFSWRPDGSIRYAENPPKKYEDIVNVDFYAKGAVPALWLALRDVVLHWRREGVRNFRVDNPHTKPLPFWAWLIRDIQAQYPDTVFLAEAFTRPKVMYQLAKIGFGQSYTYFTWRDGKAELQDYLTELTTASPRDFFRPHFFVNTPDINPFFLQRSGRPGFLIRAALACTLSGLWGMYNGFELCEARAIPGKEEYLDSEKYQLRQWDLTQPGNIVNEITHLNRLRRENPAFHSHLGLSFHNASNDQILYFSKRAATGDNAVLVAINLDPYSTQQATIEIPLWLWNLPDGGSLAATDLIQARNFTWVGKFQNLTLDPAVLPYAIWRISPVGEII